MARFFVNKLVSYRYLLFSVVFLSFIMYSFGGLLITENAITGLEAYILFINSKSNIFFFLFCILICMQFPYKDVHIILRCGKRKWLINEMLSMIGVIVLLNTFVLLICVVLFGKSNFNEWSIDFLLCYMEGGSLYEAKLGSIGDLTGWVMFGNPIKAFLTSFLLNTLCGFIVGIICFVFNVYNCHIYGPFATMFLYYIPAIMMRLCVVLGTNSPFFALTYIFDIALLYNLKIGFYGNYFNTMYVFVWYVVIIIVLAELSMEGLKKMEVR